MEIKFRSRHHKVGDKIREILVATMKIEKFTLQAEFPKNLNKIRENFGLKILKSSEVIVRYRPNDEEKICAVVTTVNWSKLYKELRKEYGDKIHIIAKGHWEKCLTELQANKKLKKHGLTLEKIQQFYKIFCEELKIAKEKYFAENK